MVIEPAWVNNFITIKPVYRVGSRFFPQLNTGIQSRSAMARSLPFKNGLYKPRLNERLGWTPAC